MLQVLSTGRRIAITNITDQHVIHRYDVFDQDFVDYILEKGRPNCIVSDHFVSAYFDNIQVIGLPLWLECHTKEFIEFVQFSNNCVTDHCFNFTINKKQINRFLCIKLVEWFNLRDFDYTWSGIGQNFDMSVIIQELDLLANKSPLSQQARSFILAPVRLEKKFILGPHDIDDNNNSVSIKTKGGPLAWEAGLNQIFSNSAVSLITESVSYQKASVFTEKTLYSVLGLTFPIWVGGYNQAKDWANMGFDIFDDIIDHSYQSYDTLVERCYFAIANNLDILSDKALATELRSQNKHRLLQNRDHALSNGIGNYVDQQITKLPTDLQQVIPEILDKFRSKGQ